MDKSTVYDGAKQAYKANRGSCNGKSSWLAFNDHFTKLWHTQVNRIWRALGLPICRIVWKQTRLTDLWPNKENVLSRKALKLTAQCSKTKALLSA